MPLPSQTLPGGGDPNINPQTGLPWDDPRGAIIDELMRRYGGDGGGGLGLGGGAPPGVTSLGPQGPFSDVQIDPSLAPSAPQAPGPMHGLTPDQLTPVNAPVLNSDNIPGVIPNAVPVGPNTAFSGRGPVGSARSGSRTTAPIPPAIPLTVPTPTPDPRTQQPLNFNSRFNVPNQPQLTLPPGQPFFPSLDLPGTQGQTPAGDFGGSGRVGPAGSGKSDFGVFGDGGGGPGQGASNGPIGEVTLGDLGINTGAFDFGANAMAYSGDTPGGGGFAGAGGQGGQGGFGGQGAQGGQGLAGDFGGQAGFGGQGGYGDSAPGGSAPGGGYGAGGLGGAVGDAANAVAGGLASGQSEGDLAGGGQSAADAAAAAAAAAGADFGAAEGGGYGDDDDDDDDDS